VRFNKLNVVEPQLVKTEAKFLKQSDASGFEYDTGMRFSYTRALIELNSPNTLSRVKIAFREHEKDEPVSVWTGEVYNLSAGGHLITRGPIDFNSDTPLPRFWNIVPDDAQIAKSDAPRLTLMGYPQKIYFIAQGNGPFTLAFGRQAVPVSTVPFGDLLAKLKSIQPDLKATDAQIGRIFDLGGAEALKDRVLAKDPSEWKVFALWGLLILIVLIAGGMGISLLRENKERQTP
jgi:hypothetical protein